MIGESGSRISQRCVAPLFCFLPNGNAMESAWNAERQP